MEGLLPTRAPCPLARRGRTMPPALVVERRTVPMKSCRVRMPAVAMALLGPLAAAPAEQLDTVLVIGTRGSLESAVERKRDQRRHRRQHRRRRDPQAARPQRRRCLAAHHRRADRARPRRGLGRLGARAGAGRDDAQRARDLHRRLRPRVRLRRPAERDARGHRRLQDARRPRASKAGSAAWSTCARGGRSTSATRRSRCRRG